MEQIKTKVKRWGNSFGVIIPSDIVTRQNLKEGSELELTIQPQNKMTVGDLMKLSQKLGLAKKLKGLDTQKALDETDKELWPEEE